MSSGQNEIKLVKLKAARAYLSLCLNVLQVLIRHLFRHVVSAFDLLGLGAVRFGGRGLTEVDEVFGGQQVGAGLPHRATGRICLFK